MNEIAVISDLVENQKEEEEFLFIKQTKDVKSWFIKTKLPNGNAKYQRYATKPAYIRSGPIKLNGPSLTSSDIELRNEIIQDKINELSREGFHVEKKYVSLFVSGKIKELILSRQHQKNKSQKQTEKQSKSAETDVMEDSVVGRILKHHNQRNS
nr:hypothetical protein [uncultured Duganella sp.]